jgi:geranylgeranyl diphosphate synthase type I
VDRLYDYGRQLGIAFQIWDDVLGLKGDQSKLGKPVGSDIRNGKKTLIAIDALEHMPDGEGREALLAALGNPDASDVAVKEAIARLEEFGSIERAKKAAIDYVLDSKAKLQSVPDSAEKDFLLALADYAISREL